MPEEPTVEDYKQFFEESPVALVRTDLKTGAFLMANKFAAHLFGYDSVDDLKAKARSTDLYPAEERRKLVQRLKKKGVVENYEIQMTLPGGRAVWVSACLRLSGDGRYIEGSYIDITELVHLRTHSLVCLKETGRKLDQKIKALAG